MKHIPRFVFLTIIVFSISCRDQGVGPSRTGEMQFGKVALNFPPAPEGILQVVANLTREGFESRSLILNISDSIGRRAGGTIENLQTGAWHLVVVAYDSIATRYRGETDVDVLSGQTTRVELLLSPMTGNIEINVRWGSTNQANETLVPLQVHAPSGAGYTLEFGLHPNAMPCEDSLDLSAPPIPPQDSFDARFVKPRASWGDFYCFEEGLWRDLRPGFGITPADTYKVRVQINSSGYPITVMWPKVSSLYPNGISLRVPLDGSVVNLDMRTTTEFFWTEEIESEYIYIIAVK